MPWESESVTHSVAVLVQSLADAEVQQAWLELATAHTGRTRSLQGYLVTVRLGDQVFSSGRCADGLLAVKTCGAVLQQHGFTLLAAGASQPFQESGLSSGTGYGYVGSSKAVHVSSQGYTTFSEPNTVGHDMHWPDIDSARVCYFAYGSNMSLEQMKQRCPGAQCLGTAVLLGFQYRINQHGVATLVPNAGASVHGAMWLLDPVHQVSLDIYEGVPVFYRRFFVSMQHGHEALHTLVYLANDSLVGVARSNYQEKIVQAARQLNMPFSYVQQLEGWLPGSAG